MLTTLSYNLRVIWACAKKDIRSALTERAFTTMSIFIPVNILILLSLFVLAGSQAPTAVVMNDRGPYAQQFYNAMAHAHSFSLQQTDAATARGLIQSGRIVSVVTVPADFDTRLQHHQPVTVEVEINNLNTDFTNDIRRAVPLSITSFYAKAFPHLVTVTPLERDFYPQDTDYIPYLTVSILVISLMIGGIIPAGTGVAREWELETMKELLLSPAPLWAILVGKLLGALILSLASVLVVLAVLILIIGVWPVHWWEVIAYTLITLIIFLAFGALIGTLLKNRRTMTALAMAIIMPLFFLSGAFGPISFNTPSIQLLAKLSPAYYAIVLQQHAFHGFRLNTLSLGSNVLVLCGYALVVLVLAVIALRRSTVLH
jgi:ABC-2 type transport system permease protein